MQQSLPNRGSILQSVAAREPFPQSTAMTFADSAWLVVLAKTPTNRITLTLRAVEPQLKARMLCQIDLFTVAERMISCEIYYPHICQHDIGPASDLEYIREHGHVYARIHWTIIPEPIAQHNQALYTLWRAGELTDVRIMCGVETDAAAADADAANTIPAHAVVLSARSSVFAGMFRTKCLETTTRVVTTSYAESTMRALLTYIYRDDLPALSVDSAIDLLEAAHYYAIPTLIEACGHVLASNLSVENVLTILSIADRYEATALRDTAIQYARNRVNQISDKSLETLEVSLCVRLIRAQPRNESGTNPQRLTDAIKPVRRSWK